MNLGVGLSFTIYLLIIFYKFVICGRNFYSILNVNKDATLREIKSAYRSLAKVLHPDKNLDDPLAKEKFQDLAAAYECLSDEEKRAIYDKSGEEGLQKLSGADSRHDPFSSFFGDFFGNGDSNRDVETPTGAEVNIDLFVSLEEIYSGIFVEITRKKSIYKQISGTRKCNCRHEMRTTQLSAGRFQMFQVQVCDECPNVMLKTVIKTLEVEVEIGVDDGHTIRFSGEGEPHIDGNPGDLIFKLRVDKHKVFKRHGIDLYTNLTISLDQALNGFKMDIEHLDGHKVHITRDSITWPGSRIRKKDEGMISSEDLNKKGFLYITFDVKFPRKEFTNEQKAILKELLKQDNFKIKSYNGLQGF